MYETFLARQFKTHKCSIRVDTFFFLKRQMSQIPESEAKVEDGQFCRNAEFGWPQLETPVTKTHRRRARCAHPARLLPSPPRPSRGGGGSAFTRAADARADSARTQRCATKPRVPREQGHRRVTPSRQGPGRMRRVRRMDEEGEEGGWGGWGG